ncbi:MAG: hypothetical protein RL385_1929, partial [Pseudomonadota bacterium]
MTQIYSRALLASHAYALAVLLTGVSACTESEDGTADSGGGDAGAATPGPVVALDGGAGGGVTRATDASIPAATTGDGGSAAASGSAWCKAKAVLDEKCGSCHGAKVAAGAPMPLATFADTQGMGPINKDKTIVALIKARTHLTQGAMPPGAPLPAAELAVLDAWIDSGATAGDDPTCGGASAPTESVEEFKWPDICTEQYRYKILAHGTTAKDPLMVPAGQETHPRVNFDAPWGSAEVQAIAMKPITDNAKVLHHWILYQTGTGAFITGWAPGKDKRLQLPDDVGMYLPSGTGAMYLDLHYFNATGTQSEPDNSGVEICAVPKAMAKKNTATVFMGFGANGLVMAPANTMSHRQTGTCKVVAREPVHVLTASPHAHNLAKGMDFRATVGGKEIVMHEGPFDFNEQKMYRVPGGEVVLNTGDTVTTTCIFDNTTNRNVGFG